MADKVHFELVTPTELLLAEDADMVVVPGEAGDFGVLPGHAPLMSTVRPGTVEVYQGSQVARKLFVEGGFAEVTDDRCTVLAEEAMPVAQINRAEADTAVIRARTAVETAADDAGRALAERQLAIAEARVAAAVTGERGGRA